MKSYKRIALENIGAKFEYHLCTISVPFEDGLCEYANDNMGEAAHRAYEAHIAPQIRRNAEELSDYGWVLTADTNWYVWYDESGATVAGHLNKDVATSIAHVELLRRIDGK